ncbi:MAG TPA: 4a-hydroxytetrahydrobiopterin dehydratase [Candidatus Kryptonia bacterium]|nr:4a-hydroxytetrahydrobiopterin dehydratase [Candidatus Kryptonia bacterium]
MSELANKHCVPCKGGVPPLTGVELEPLRAQIDRDWSVVDEHHLSRLYRFKSFAPALAFVNRVGTIAEAQNHHPDICLAWGRVRVDIWTHKINGLTESDFIFAAKCDAVYEP